MKKYVLDLRVTENLALHTHYVLLKATSPDGSKLPEMLPGQFAELRVDGSPTTFLRRPISVNFVDVKRNEVWFLIQLVGDGTRRLSTLKSGDVLNAVLPLGNSFSLPEKNEKVLLIGGGVGTAPMLFLGSYLRNAGFVPHFLLGTTTEDGSHGEKGYVTQHSLLQKEHFDRIYTCGPKPMMVAVARYAKGKGIKCEVSLENMMACGVGACLCCVENTTEGHICVCKEGPVFNIENLLWQI